VTTDRQERVTGVGLPKGVAASPRLARWVTVAPDNTVSLRVGKVELGQGIVTALAQLAAEELDVDLPQVRMLPASTAQGPDEGVTAGSMSVADSGAAVRLVCANVRALFVEAAAARWRLDPADLAISGGVISEAVGARRTSYGDLAPFVDLDRDVDASIPVKGPDSGRVVGTDAARIDLPDKIAGRPRFIHDLALPGQLYGRVVRPPSPAARLTDVDVPSTRRLPGVVAVVRDGSFLGVVADDEAVAVRAAETLRGSARWHEQATLPDEDDLPTFLRSGPTHTTVVDDTAPTDSDGARRLRATYNRPFLAHASMAPSCGVAQWDDAGTTVSVWSHSQGIHGLHRAIAMALDLDERRVAVCHVEGAGCYGHNAADDAAFDAVLLARAVPGRPVHVQWSRHDELTWSPFGSAMSVDVAADIDADGTVHAWSYDVWSQGHTARPGYEGTPGLLAGAHLDRPIDLPPPADPPVAAGGGTARNAIPIYQFPARRIHAHRALRAPLRSSALRSLGSFMNVFAIESFMDELALAVDQDPLDYRRRHLTDERGRAVLDAAAELGGWASRGSRDGVGLGIGFARYKQRGAYCAVVAEVEAVHEVRVRRLAIAVDVGRVVNPDGVRNQIEGGAIQATSWTTTERVRFDRTRVISGDWETYPILRFSEAPRVDVRLVSRPDLPSVGAGEAAQGPTAAAIANAVAGAIGVRVRNLPLTTEAVLAALDD
jgi:CO/xanthine dehydrogenase Mo-binding subunit